MKLKVFLLLLFTSFFIGFISCSNKPKTPRKPVVKIEIQPKKNQYRFGDSVSISISVKLPDGELKDCKLFVQNELVKTSAQQEFSYSMPKVEELGKHSIKAVATKTDGVEGINFSNFEIVSDIEPDLFGYEVVKTYPHSTEHFTQGLEIHEGKFYESTGEKGKSAIYQFDLETGKTLQTKKLEDKYFGEGITIFDDKIYQLTQVARIVNAAIDCRHA
jgi:glutaminyl-peptide cyclotransferase